MYYYLAAIGLYTLKYEIINIHISLKGDGVRCHSNVSELSNVIIRSVLLICLDSELFNITR